MTDHERLWRKYYVTTVYSAVVLTAILMMMIYNSFRKG